MIALANERLQLLRDRGYEDACIYGENEMDGLHVIQVLKHGMKPPWRSRESPDSSCSLPFGHHETRHRCWRWCYGSIALLQCSALLLANRYVGLQRRQRRYHQPETGEVTKQAMVLTNVPP